VYTGREDGELLLCVQEMHGMHLLERWLSELGISGHSDVLGHTTPDLCQRLAIMVLESVTIMVLESDSNDVRE
jgi:hypothetical protein